MGKDKPNNPMDEFRRKQRKKQLQKDKTKRIQERDAAVKETKTVAEVKAAIAQLEHRKNKSHHDTTKLQRLQKELKIVTEAAKQKAQIKAAEPRAYYESKLGGGHNAQRDDPRKSVYYDAQMNPYGAPPPGKPRLYHARGGGTTMNLSEATVPGQSDVQRAPEMMNLVEAGRMEKQRRDERSKESGRTGEERNRGHPHFRDRGKQRQRNQQKSAVSPPPPPPPPTDKPPELPPPSASVKRGRKRHRLEADIWASAGEIHYEQHVHGIDLEAGGEDFTDQWYYRDLQGQVQGPFGRLQMHSWSRAGFFPPSTPVRNGKRGKFASMGTVDWSTGLVVQTEEDVARAERIAALRKDNRDLLSSPTFPNHKYRSEKNMINSDGLGRVETENHQGVQRSTQTPTIANGIEDDGTPTIANGIEDDGIAARIAALRGENAELSSAVDSTETRNEDPTHENNGSVMEKPAIVREAGLATRSVDETAKGEEESDEGVAARLAALRGEKSPKHEVCDLEKDHQPSGSSQMAVVLAPPITDIMDDESRDESPGREKKESDGIESRIAVLRKQTHSPLGVAETRPSSSATSDKEDSPIVPLSAVDGPGGYPIDDDEPASTYPLDDEGEEAYGAISAYPVDDDEHEVPAYPVDEEQTSFQTFQHPASELYSVHVNEGDSQKAQVQREKVSKIDKDVVAFLPTNLQMKRRKNKQTPDAPAIMTKSKDNLPQVKKSSVSDEYKDFMEEINQL